MTVLFNAIKRLRPNVNFGIGNEDDWNTIQMSDGSARPTDTEINSVLQQAREDTAVSILRIERNQLLQQTDWMALNDVVVSEEWKAYRQALRDLPANSEPQLDENGQLTNVTWPTKPEENT